MSHRIVTHNQTVTRSSRLWTGLLVPLAVLLSFGQGQAQAVGVAQLNATIVNPIAISVTTDLKFGNVLQGQPKTVSRAAVGSDTSAAVFAITGDAGAGIAISFTLPQYLTNATGARLPISFSATDCTVDSLAGTPDAPGGGAWVGVNPFNLPAAKIGVTNSGTSVYLGGKITPQVQQAPGAYSGDIIISVVYDGT